MSLAYRHNNYKLQKIITLQENKRKMYAGVAELKMKLHLWKDLILGGLFKTQEEKSKAIWGNPNKLFPSENNASSNNEDKQQQ